MPYIASVMNLYPNKAEEYKKRHDELWPELSEALKSHGVAHYSIFLHPTTQQLFATLYVEDELRWAKIADTEICQKWWRYMADIMETNSNFSPVSIDLQPVFYLD